MFHSQTAIDLSWDKFDAERAANNPNGTYKDLGDFQKDAGDFGPTANAARAFSGMSYRYDKTHTMSVPEILDKVTEDQRTKFRLNPESNTHANQYHNLKNVKNTLDYHSRDNPTLMKSLKQIRGPHALNFIQQMSPENGDDPLYPTGIGGRPDIIAERVKNAVADSKPYR